jgi:dihydropteroate synthase
LGLYLRGTMFVQKQINCKGYLLDLTQPQIMGILNLTPDSFFDGGKWLKEEAYLQQAEQMLKEGAAILDVGGMSSRPGSKAVSLEEELNRVVEPIQRLHQEFPKAIISIDTYRAKVAKAAVQAGASMLNDISAGNLDPELLKTVGELEVPYILMHMQGKPENMQQNPNYQSILTEVLDFFIQKLEKIRAFGIKDVILDLGFGFGKTLEHNYQLLAGMKQFQVLGLPILAGLSRKSMICKLLKVNPDKALNGTTAAHVLALEQGAQLLRVHDVKEAKEAIKIWETYKKMQLNTTNKG